MHRTHNILSGSGRELGSRSAVLLLLVLAVALPAARHPSVDHRQADRRDLLAAGTEPLPGSRKLQQPSPGHATAPGVELSYAEFSIWERYRREIIGLVAILLLEAVLILKLLAERAGRHRAQAALDFRVRSLEFILDMSTAATHSGGVQVAEWIESWLGRLGESLGVDEVALYEASDSGEAFHLFRRWSPDAGQRLPADLGELPWTRRVLSADGIVRFGRLSELPEEAASDRDAYAGAGVQAYLAAPLSEGDRSGVLSLAMIGSERDWPEEIMVHLRTVAELFGAALARNQAEGARRASDQLNRALLESLAVPTVLLDRDGAVLEVSGTWGEADRPDGAGAPVPVSVGRNYLEMCRRAAAAGTPGAQEAFEGVAAVLNGTRREFRYRRPAATGNGPGRLEVHVAPLQLPAGGAILTEIDLDERERTAREVEELRHTMTHLGRVAGLAGLAELSGSLAHELNQPLTAILSNVQAAKRFLAGGSPPAGELQEILADIEEDDKRAGDIIRRLRALIRKEGIEYQSVSLNELAGQVSKLMADDLRLRRISLEFDLDPALPDVRADSMALQQVILNLMLNAADATGQSAPDRRRLVIRTWQPGDHTVALSIRDYGPGIRDGSPDRIFQPFYTTKEHGLGIGLTICSSIVAAHGGRIWAVNNADAGVTVQFTLPLRPATLS